MDLSVIIAHYTPTLDHPCLQTVTRTFSELARQCKGLEAEVLVCDDGSPLYRRHSNEAASLVLPDGREYYDFTGEEALAIVKERFPLVEVPPITHWLYLEKTKPCSSKARLWNLAVERAQADKLIFFDDDNYLNQTGSLLEFKHLLDRYRVVFGQVIDRKGRARSYKSHRVQGTTFGMHQSLWKQIGGFGEWTESVSSGIDSDLWFKLHRELQSAKPHEAAYTDKIQSVDGCSKRWKPFVGSLFRHKAVRQAFEAQYGCSNYRDAHANPSRKKSTWMDNLTRQAS
ncbi:MAG: glycosyltransferase family 2 protein [Lentisphaeria bacterium]|nr:glycosyltransferase family 2 protein [Candidatus Neomarinimicrobiota bacterium]MCF7843030.1 glycosyltransferase family 2 protein [Lentisphaeria bacterium]